METMFILLFYFNPLTEAILYILETGIRNIVGIKILILFYPFDHLTFSK